MDKVYVCRHKVLTEGRSIRSVAKELGISRNTIKKYLKVPEPKFECKVKKRSMVSDTIKPRILELLDEWSTRVTTKQRITGRRILRQLHEEGFEVGITSVLKILRENRRNKTEVFVPLVHRAGDEAQVDFFEVIVDVNGERRKAHMFAMRLMYSGYDFAWLYEHCDQVSFLDGHVRAFEHFGGVPSRCIYDNLKPAVKRIVGAHRNLGDRFLALASHYLFEPCFARVGTGHDKGGIESRGKGIRWEHLTPIPQGQTLNEISESLLASITKTSSNKRDRSGKSVSEKFGEESKVLRPLPDPSFEPREVVPLMVSRQAIVNVGQATYSVPCHWQGLMIQAFVGPRDIRFACREEVVTRDRVLPKQKNIKYKDYIQELRKKPQALRQVAPELLNELAEPFRKLYKLLEESHGAKESARIFAKVLGAISKHGEHEVELALEQALAGGKHHLLFLLDKQETELMHNDVPEKLSKYNIESAKAQDYDALLEGGVA